MSDGSGSNWHQKLQSLAFSFFPSQQETHCFSDYYLLTTSPAFSQQEAPIFLSPFHLCQELKITVPTYWECGRTMAWNRLFVLSLCLWQSFFCQEMPTLSLLPSRCCRQLTGTLPASLGNHFKIQSTIYKVITFQFELRVESCFILLPHGQTPSSPSVPLVSTQ